MTPSGVGTYMRANSVRQVLGLPLTTAAPIAAPPAPLSAIVELNGESTHTVAIVITHSYTVLTGLSVIVRATPAMPTVAVKPLPGDYRYVMGVSPSSAKPLLVSGSDLLFTPSRFIIGNGERYGVEARIVRTADGIMSNPVYGDFIKIV